MKINRSVDSVLEFQQNEPQNQQTILTRIIKLFYFFLFFFRVDKSLACHSPSKWCLCA